MIAGLNISSIVQSQLKFDKDGPKSEFTPRFTQINSLSQVAIQHLCEQLEKTLSRYLRNDIPVEGVQLASGFALSCIEHQIVTGKFQNVQLDILEFKNNINAAVEPLVANNYEWITAFKMLPLTNDLLVASGRLMDQYGLFDLDQESNTPILLDTFLSKILKSMEQISNLIGVENHIYADVIKFCYFLLARVEINIGIIDKLSVMLQYSEKYFQSYQQQVALKTQEIKDNLQKELKSSQEISLTTVSEIHARYEALLRQEQIIHEAKVQIWEKSVHVLELFHSLAIENYVQARVALKFKTLEKCHELQKLIMSSLAVKSPILGYNDARANICEVQEKLLIGDPESLKGLRRPLGLNFTRCQDLAIEINANRRLHQNDFYCLGLTEYITPEKLTKFTKDEFELESELLKERKPFEGSVYLFDEASRIKIYDLIENIKSHGEALNAKSDKIEKGQALKYLADRMKGYADRHYTSVYRQSKILTRSFQDPSRILRNQLLGDLTETFNDPRVGHHCNSWKMLKVYSQNALLCIFAPAVFVKHYFTGSYFYWNHTSTQEFLESATHTIRETLGC